MTDAFLAVVDVPPSYTGPGSDAWFWGADLEPPAELLPAATKALPAPGAPLAPWPAGMPVPITALDVTRALAVWDVDVPDAAGLWDAQVVGRAAKARRKPV